MTKNIKGPRHGNPSDPAEEAERVRKAHENLTKWQDRHSGFSGGLSMQNFSGVSMQMGDGKRYEVPIGDPKIAIAQTITSRPLPPILPMSRFDPRLTTPEAVVRSLGIDPHFAPESKPAPSLLRRLSVFIFGERS
jgi:hypothetical protein